MTTAEQALKFKPDYVKAILRAIQCCVQLKEFDKCFDLCDKYLKLLPGDNNVIGIKKNALKAKVNLSNLIVCNI